MKKLIFLLIMIAVLVSKSYAQKKGQGKIDSLFAVLKAAKADTSKVNTLNNLAIIFTNNNPDTSIYFASEAQVLATKLNYKMGTADSYLDISIATASLGKNEESLKTINDALKIYDQLLPIGNGTKKTGSKSKILNQKALAYNNIGRVYSNQGNYPEALKNYLVSLKIREEIGDKKGIAASYNNIGLIYVNQGNFLEGLKNHFASLKIKEEIGDKYGIAVSYNNIGNIYDDQDNYPEALKNYFAALKIDKEIGSKQGIANCYNNIGIIYQEQGNYPEALKNYFNSLKIEEEIGYKYGIAATYSNIGNIYYAQGNYPEALKKQFTSLKIKEEIGDKYGIANSCNYIGIIYTKQKKYNEASQFLNKGLSLAKDIGSLNVINESYSGLAALDSSKGDFKRAWEHYKMYIITRDSMFNVEKTKKIMQIGFDKKEAVSKAEQEKKDAIAHKELQRQKLVRNGFIGGFAVVLLFAGVFFRQRIRISKEKKKSEELLLNILPSQVAEELKQTGHCQAKTFSMVTVMFMDFKDFTSVSERVSAELLVDEINSCFSAFDGIIQKYNIEKIKTVGDSYICAGGLPALNLTHALDIVTAAIEIQNFMLDRKKEKESKREFTFEMRIGIHTGAVVAGIVGVKKFQYDIWGDTVNIAARMEQNSEAGKINISGNTYKLVKEKFHCVYRGKIEAKNKGEVEMYFVTNPQQSIS